MGLLTQCASEQAAPDAAEALARDAGPAADSGDAASRSGQTAASRLPSCGSVGGLCPLPADFQLQLLIESASFGPAARFAAIGGRTVLVNEAGKPARIAQLKSPGTADKPPLAYRSFGLHSADLEVIAVGDDATLSPSSLVYALVCSAQTSCNVWRSSPTDEGSLEPLPGSELNWRPRGLVVDPGLQRPVPCVYGPRFQCFDGMWAEPLTVPAGSEIVDVALGSGVSFAVGTQASVWIRAHPADSWQPQWVGTDDFELSAVSVSDRFGAAFGTQGEVLGLQENFTWSCQWNSQLALVSPSTSLDRISVVTKQGRVLRRSQSPGPDFCESQMLDVGEILSSSRVTCSASGNIWVMTERQVWGEFACLEVP